LKPGEISAAQQDFKGYLAVFSLVLLARETREMIPAKITPLRKVGLALQAADDGPF
jgi:hypothetical protein